MMLMSRLNSGTGMAALVALLPLLTSTEQSSHSFCPMKFKRIGESHSACLKPATQATNVGVSDADKLAIVKRHNEGRSKVQPPAQNMLKMYWDEEVAQIAQGWAQNCDYKHDEKIDRNIPGRFALGQNIGKGHRDWMAMIDGWYDEYKHFSHGTGSTDGSPIGHYTQIVWADSLSLGCGFALCSGSATYVCNYGPAGNVASKNTPYQSGSTLEATCPTYQDGNLCDCGSHPCANGGTMNRETCKCTCVEITLQFIKGDFCSLNCTLAKQNILTYCGGHGYVKASCGNTMNVPYECPIMCEVCPWAGVDYDEEHNAMNNAERIISPMRILTIALSMAALVMVVDL